MINQTLCIIKPDAVERRLSWPIIEMATAIGLKLVAYDTRVMTRELTEEIYAEHREKEWFPLQVAYMTSGPVDLCVLEGEDAVVKWRTLMGATDHTKAAPGTIRALYAQDYRRNSVHGSDSPENATREIMLVYGQSWVYTVSPTDLLPIPTRA